MAKDTFYFSHDYNARSDEKVKLLIRKHGILGYGVYWAIVEDLYNNANALRMDCEGIAFDLRVDEKVVKSIINEFDLFVIDGDEFGSMSVQRRLDERDAKSKKARASAKKRWSEKSKEDANALQTHSERNAIKERKGKEIKEKKKEYSDFDLAFIDFEKMRKIINKPLTDRAKQMVLTKLNSLAKDEPTKIKILENSIVNNWQDVYPLKENQKVDEKGQDYIIVKTGGIDYN